MAFTREQLLADPLWRAEHGLPPLKPEPKPTYSPPRPMPVLVDDEAMLAAGIGYIPEPKPGETAKPAAGPFAVNPTNATSADLDAMFQALKSNPK